MLYYCTGLISSTSFQSHSPLNQFNKLNKNNSLPVDFPSSASLPVGLPGYLYISQSYIGIYIRQGVLTSVVLRELYEINDLIDIKIFNRNDTSTSHNQNNSNSNNSESVSNNSNRNNATINIPIDTSSDMEFDWTESNPTSTTKSSSTSASSASSGSTSTLSSSTGSLLSSIGLSYLTVSCQLIFRSTKNNSSNNPKESPYQIITMTPALITTDKLIEVLVEIKEMVKNVNERNSLER